MDDFAIDRIKGKLAYMWNNENINVSYTLPENSEWDPNLLQFSKTWVTAIHVEILDLNNIIDSSYNDESFMGKILLTFYEGITDIFKYYNIMNWTYSRGAISGIISTPNKNSIGASQILNAAYDINGFLGYFWKRANYKISLCSKPEFFMKIENNNQLIDLGGALFWAKEMAKRSSLSNIIQLDTSFIENNRNLLINQSNGQPIYTIKEIPSPTGFETIKEFYVSIMFNRWKG